MIKIKYEDMFSPNATYDGCQYVETYSGVKFNLSKPNHNDIFDEDIIQSLTQINRFGGHTIIPYTVATHVMLVTDIGRRMGCSANVIRHMYIHDHPEYLVGDSVSPMKRLLSPLFQNVEDPILHCIYKKYNLELPTDEELELVKIADLLALGIERINLRNLTTYDWGFSPDFWATVYENTDLFRIDRNEEFKNMFDYYMYGTASRRQAEASI